MIRFIGCSGFVAHEHHNTPISGLAAFFGRHARFLSDRNAARCRTLVRLGQALGITADPDRILSQITVTTQVEIGGG
jgi:hypothetical protein